MYKKVVTIQPVAKRVSVPISTARKQLFQLTDLVRKSGDDTVVVRGQPGRRRAERGQATIYVPVLVLVEVAEAIRGGTVRADGGYSRWAERLLGSAGFVAVDLTPAIVRAAEGLYTIPERGDRLIAATASHLECPLTTKDPVLARVPGLKTMW
jgi:PIN domain nuclease of toxin-antitoxin system